MSRSARAQYAIGSKPQGGGGGGGGEGEYLREVLIGVCLEGLRKRNLIPFVRPKPEKLHPIQGKKLLMNEKVNFISFL